MLKKLGRVILGGVYMATYFIDEYPARDFGDGSL